MRRSLVSVFLGAFLCATTAPALAQQGTAEISGRVTDEQGGVLPGVAIVVTNEATGLFREVTSSAEGTYLASQLAPGRYKVVARLAGFRTGERSGLLLQVGTTMAINMALAIGGVEETITVTGQSPLVDTTSARVGGNIGTGELSELPAMNRNYFAAVALLPGVQFSPSNQMGNDTIIAGGQTSQNNNVAVDGGYNADDALGTSAGAQVRTPLEAIQEFQVLTGTYSGTALNAMQNVESRGGRNGALGPDYFQVDVRAGWRGRMRRDQPIEVFLDIFNITNRANFSNPSGDERVPATFLVLTNLRGGGGFPRQAQVGVRYAF